MRLPFGYPAHAPGPAVGHAILHPNVSFSGFIHVRDLGLPWDDTVTLDVVCERLWDTARLAYVNLDRTTNFSARNWLEGQHTIALPTDARPLRDLAPPGGKNVVRYQRRGAPPPAHAGTATESVFHWRGHAASPVAHAPGPTAARRDRVATTISCTSGMNEEGVPVECFVLLMLFVFIAILASGIGLGAGPHGQARAYEQLTRRFGGLFQRGGFLRRCSARFRYGQTWVVVDTRFAPRPGSGRPR